MSGDAPDEFALRQGQASDLRSLLALQKATTGGPHWSALIWDETLNDAGSRGVLVLHTPQELVGFIVLRVVAGVAELEGIAISPQYQRRGLARRLFERGRAWAVDAGAAEMLLEVRVSNAAAISLYQALGFTQQGLRCAYYAAPVEDAWMMALSLRMPAEE